MASEFGNALQLIQITSSLATPLIVLVLGLLINRRLEQSKLSLSKEKEWQTKWADGFFSRAIAFNDAIEDYILLLWEVGEFSRKTNSESISKAKEKKRYLAAATEKLIRAEWLLKSHINFAPTHGSGVLKAAADAMTMVRRIRDSGTGDLNEVRTALFEFNVTAKNAHHEMLSL